MKTKKSDFKRVNINLPINLIERVTKYGNEIGINTTSAYIVLLNQALDQKESITSLPLLMKVYDELKSNATDSEDN